MEGLWQTQKRYKRFRLSLIIQERKELIMDEQLLSLETQKEHYDNFINANPEWEYAGLYYDEGNMMD